MGDATDETVEVVVVGDVHLSRESPETAFENVRELFDRADLVVGNLEGAQSNEGELSATNRGHALRSPPEMVTGLTAAGFDVVSMANNHTMDYGPDALVDTIERLEEHGIEFAGAGRTRPEAERVSTTRVNGYTVGVVSFEATDLTWHDTQATVDRPGVNRLHVSPFYPEPYVSAHDLEKAKRIVETARESVDVLVATLHAGESIDHTITVQQRALARLLVEAGADAVVGHHPHTVQAIDVHRGAPIFYSTSNFVFDELPVMRRLPRARKTGVAWLRFGADGVSAGRFYPMWIDDRGTPGFAGPATNAEAFFTVEDLSRREGLQLDARDDHFRIPL